VVIGDVSEKGAAASMAEFKGVIHPSFAFRPRDIAEMNFLRKQ
jgi:hypothetical protein